MAPTKEGEQTKKIDKKQQEVINTMTVMSVLLMKEVTRVRSIEIMLVQITVVIKAEQKIETQLAAKKQVLTSLQK